MKRSRRIYVSAVGLMAAMMAGGAWAQSPDFALYDGGHVASVVYSGKGATPGLAARMLAGDLQKITGQAPVVATRLAACRPDCVVIGDLESPLVKQLAQAHHIDLATLSGAWERYGRVVITTSAHQNILLIYGADRRGMIYGVVDLSREMGVSAWEWWADVAPRRVERLHVSAAPVTSKAPSVTYRGIFLNDEDWGLKPWAAKTYDPQTGNIGPKTYARIYELMWRLKANTLWPAMHDVSTPFYDMKANPKLANDYAIVMGTSHSEALMRNNFGEWNEKRDGAFNIFTNRNRMTAYWQKRVSEVKGFDNLYTVGLRGVHDTPMEGADTQDQARQGLQIALDSERDILSRTLSKPADKIPQTMTLYKEVLDTYQSGFKVPEDITLLWPDDNYGYIRQLPTEAEIQRPGGTGVYYHLSYWGQPHDYLWLATTHPGLIAEEMGKAWSRQSRREWIFNVGDIKPAEFLTQYALDLAFDADGFSTSPREALRRWAATQFDDGSATDIAAILMDYYDLAFSRRPEFLGWNGVEPVTRPQTDGFIGEDGYEAQARLAAYARLTARAEALGATLPVDRQAAYFELVLYPVRSAGNLNKRILSLDLAALYARDGRAGANSYVRDAQAAQAGIDTDTAAYNALENGKWRHMMDARPRDLPVFTPPAWPHYAASDRTGCDLAFSGGRVINAHDFPRLTFVRGVPGDQVIEVYSREAKDTPVTITPIAGISTDTTRLTLDEASRWQSRLGFHWNGQGQSGRMTITCGAQTFNVPVDVVDGPSAPVDAVETERRVTIPAASTASGDWEVIDELGSQGSVLRSRLDLPGHRQPQVVTPLSYSIFTTSAGEADLTVIALPTHPLSPETGLKVGVQVDDGPIQTVDFKTVGRSDTWKRNVLSNTALGQAGKVSLSRGDHAVKIYALDPGVVLDRIELTFPGAPQRYAP